jgi:hypothetical protein
MRFLLCTFKSPRRPWIAAALVKPGRRTYKRAVWNALIAAIVGAGASLAGVTLGALVEPWKLAAAHKARTKQDRADRCAHLIEAAIVARQHVIDLNILHRRRTLTNDSVQSDEQREIEYEDNYYVARAKIRSSLALLTMSGPDELIDLGQAIRDADKLLHDTRFVLDADGTFNRLVMPAQLRDAAMRLDAAISEFARAARGHTA